MDSYGELLKKTREEKNLDVEKISREITIEKDYLLALEAEDSGVFPGEAYLTGFLRNYANYLDLDSEFVLKLYHNKKIQESPVPEALIARKKIPSFVFTIILPVSLIAIFAIVTLVLVLVKKSKLDEENVAISSKNVAKQIELSESLRWRPIINSNRKWRPNCFVCKRYFIIIWTKHTIRNLLRRFI